MNFALFLSTLPYMAMGLGGIFAVTLLIILCVIVLNTLTAGKSGK